MVFNVGIFGHTQISDKDCLVDPHDRRLIRTCSLPSADSTRRREKQTKQLISSAFTSSHRYNLLREQKTKKSRSQFLSLVEREKRRGRESSSCSIDPLLLCSQSHGLFEFGEAKRIVFAVDRPAIGGQSTAGIVQSTCVRRPSGILHRRTRQNRR